MPRAVARWLLPAAVADQDDVLAVFDVLAFGQLMQLGGVDRRLLELEVLQTLAVREVGIEEPTLGSPLSAGVELQLQQVCQVVAVRCAITAAWSASSAKRVPTMGRRSS